MSLIQLHPATSSIPGSEKILTRDALAFVAALETKFGLTRERLLRQRAERQVRIDAGEKPGFLDETSSVRTGSWQVAPCPADLQNRRVEITGPAEPKMMINALNSGAEVFMADLEDALSPTWSNVLLAQSALKDAYRRELAYRGSDGKRYALNDRVATLVVRPRGWHLVEKHATIDGRPISASLFDFGLCFFHNAREAVGRGTGPYFYLPKIESHREARLWNDVFAFSQERLGLPLGTIRATVLIETILAAFEMDEILYELREHAAGLNAGRWDYIFSLIKKFRSDPARILPDRAQVTMGAPFMRAYSELLVQTCHRRGAHAIGGMAAFIPSRKDAEVNATALAKVREDKEREAATGFDGTWVAHPDLVSIAREAFDRRMGSRPNQKEHMPETSVDPKHLTETTIEGGKITERGVRLNIEVGLRYVERWLSGTGAVAIHNLMEDAATAEISRAQLWQWIRHGAHLEDGRVVTHELYASFREEELARLVSTGPGLYAKAARIMDDLVLGSGFAEFLTLSAYMTLADSN